MRLKRIFKKAAVLCACFLFAASAFLPRQVYASDQDSGTSLSHLKDARIGVQTDLTVTYKGDRFDPRQTDNKLSLAVLQSTAEEIRYSYDPDSEEPNRVVIFIKE